MLIFVSSVGCGFILVLVLKSSSQKLKPSIFYSNIGRGC